MPLFLEKNIHYVTWRCSSDPKGREEALPVPGCEATSVLYMILGEPLPSLSSVSFFLSMKVMEPTSGDSEFNEIMYVCDG